VEILKVVRLKILEIFLGIKIHIFDGILKRVEGKKFHGILQGNYTFLWNFS